MKKDRETASQRYDTQHRAERFSVGGKNVEILSAVHQLQRSQKVMQAASANQSQI